MKVKITKSFRDKLNRQIKYIAKDKPLAARKFKTDLLSEVQKISEMPYKNRKSIFFNRNDIRDLVFKGYLIVYKVNIPKNTIEVFGFTKWEDDPFN